MLEKIPKKQHTKPLLGNQQEKKPVESQYNMPEVVELGKVRITLSCGGQLVLLLLLLLVLWNPALGRRRRVLVLVQRRVSRARAVPVLLLPYLVSHGHPTRAA